MSMNISERNVLFYLWYSKEGLSYDAIAERAYKEGLTDKILTREAVRQAIGKNPHHKPRTKSEARLLSSHKKEEIETRLRDNIVFLYTSGLSAKDISYRTNREQDLIELFIDEYIKRSEKESNKENIIKRDKEIIKKYFDEDNPKSTSELSVEYGITETRILQIIRESGHKLRTHKEAKKLQSIKAGNTVSEATALDAMEQKVNQNIPYSRYCREHGIKYHALMRTIRDILNPS